MQSVAGLNSQHSSTLPFPKKPRDGLSFPKWQYYLYETLKTIQKHISKNIQIKHSSFWMQRWAAMVFSCFWSECFPRRVSTFPRIHLWRRKWSFVLTAGHRILQAALPVICSFHYSSHGMCSLRPGKLKTRDKALLRLRLAGLAQPAFGACAGLLCRNLSDARL